MTNNLIEAQDVFLSKINQTFSKFGLNSMMAQLYVVLYFSNKPISLDDMVERLKISKGSASVNIRALERYGAVKKIWVKGSRKDYYEADNDIYKVVIARIRSMVKGRLSELDDMVSSSSKVLDSIAPQNADEEKSLQAFKEKLEKLKNLYDYAQSIFNIFEINILDKERMAKLAGEPKSEPVVSGALS